jgi:prephenate dehydrogenase
MPELINRLCIIGVGLIGGSLARALRQANAVGEIVGAGRRIESLERAQQLGVIDRYATDLPAAVSDADVVVVAVPLGTVYKVFAAIADHLPEHCVLTDVGSSKGSVVEEARRVFGRIPPAFVPGHPIAGTERSGVDASFAELFQQRRVILTPLLETEAWAHDKIRAMWQATGAEVIDIGVQHHDEVLAATSHLPHMLAYALVDCLAQMDDRAEIFRYAAGGFRDFTRIASSDPVMWHDICVANREPLLAVLRQFTTELTQLAKAIETSDSTTIMSIFQRAKHARDNLYLE